MLQQEDISPLSDILFKEYFIRYLKGLDGGTRSRSFYSTITIASHIIEGLGDYRMSEINKTVLKEFINGFTKKTYTKGTKTDFYSQSTIDKTYQLLRGAIREASSEDGGKLLRIDFMANIKKPRSNKQSPLEPKALTNEEIQMISEIVRENKMMNVWVHLMIYTGVRPSEPLALQFGDIDYENRTVDIVRTLSQEEHIDPVTGKRTRPSTPIITDLKNARPGQRVNLQKRTLKVGNKILDILKDWESYVFNNPVLMKMKREHGTEDYLFCGTHGQFWLYDDYKQVYERLLKKQGLSISEYNPYRFRHNCCTRLLRMGINLKAVQLIMGDNTADMVMRVYANLDKTDVLKGSESFAKSIDTTLDINP
ncbi:tyrosine-type recombinase/integrase [Caproicibacter sp.]|uniref:tyrosine-type recombinase/integrase n=1 Tax=Caproicibacter sp. TaxID=2814884 RepID=UPI003988B006